MRVRLFPVDGSAAHDPIVLDSLPVVIGSSPADDVSLLDAGLEECHCELSCVDGALIVRDLGSERGTIVNNVSVVSAPVMPGDRIALGNCCFLVSYEAAPGRTFTETICRVDSPEAGEHFSMPLPMTASYR